MAPSRQSLFPSNQLRIPSKHSFALQIFETVIVRRENKRNSETTVDRRNRIINAKFGTGLNALEEIVTQRIHGDRGQRQTFALNRAQCPFRFENESRCSNTNTARQKEGRRAVQAATKREVDRCDLGEGQRERDRGITGRERGIMVRIFVRDTPSWFLLAYTFFLIVHAHRHAVNAGGHSPLLNYRLYVFK